MYTDFWDNYYHRCWSFERHAKDMQPHITKDLGSLLMFNSHLSMFYFKANSSIVTVLPNVDTSFITITFIQLHISHICFCFANLTLIFFCLCASTDVYFLISFFACKFFFTQFLAILTQISTRFSTHLFFIWFFFSYFRSILL